MPTTTINWCEWNEIINDRFVPLVENRDRYLICWGSRGSSKSDFIAKKLIFRCLSERYFRYVLIRNNYNTIKDSSYQTIKDLIYDLNLQDFFQFKLQPLEIVCVNGNKFIARGCDDTNKLKSLKDPTGAWYEEDIPDEDDFIKITTTIRTAKAEYLQEVFTINPVIEGGDYKEHWFWKRFFKEHDPDLSFRGLTLIEIEKQNVELSFTVHHSTYNDNRWIPIEFKAFLTGLQFTNPWQYETLRNGLWANKQSGGNFYKNFTPKNTGETKYYSALPLHLSFDFNVNPYMTCTIYQVHGKKAEQVDELILKTPDNTTMQTCREFMRRYPNHSTGLFIYGDPSGKKQDTALEKGHNNFTVIQRELAKYRPQMRVASSAPPVMKRGEFINEIFRAKYAGIEAIIGDNCKQSKRDFNGVKEGPDGAKFKSKVKDKETGVTAEDYGHTSDSFDYFMCECFKVEFYQFQHGSKEIKPVVGYREGNESFQY